ncbi:cyclase family protein [Thermobaculum terrenum ATCC BAA-798]|uniref:Cyclase family protein n=1 Tax=Thermobaculum terrenum (strain ATCC BAA-798 / CCMEE 7001 / YNP1) TaxID=525904 RepID=D1CIJ1_THET1|nr:cyclase family protein [Thermobaculum terrenum]ACZ43562.1 cyclase family protein [Thermobaculum terrenum ATCC BAA-798]
MSLLQQLVDSLSGGSVEVIDLTSPLSENTPVIQLPPPFANTQSFTRRVVSRYDDKGPAWFWHDLSLGEHVGTHFDAPIHWITGKDGLDVSQVPVHHLVAPAVVIDKSKECAENPDFLLEVEHIQQWQQEHGPIPRGSWLLFRTGWDARAGDPKAFLNVDESGSHTPGVSVECAKWLAEEVPIVGIGVETVGTDAGLAGSFDPPFPCHAFLLGAGKYGLTQLANLSKLPPKGALLIVAPLPIVGGTGSPARVLALVER